ncbi:hypothetical protein C8F04DRAFT_1242057 [Mycena alexandri]|uniref:F-box domain-containing protein n=1 Tax=Mycena alexandri TaxID=1745969 RepID=A0AAD6WQV9_9AGAR|nr:hypothetical protein C8F04DRAFT_1242057 [Mycena alexandri]
MNHETSANKLTASTWPSQGASLVDDLVLLILDFCDVAAIIAMSETNKAFNRLASSKSVWLTAVTRVVRRGFVHREEGEVLSELSLEQLVDKARRAVRGPQTWALDRLGPAVVSREISLPIEQGAPRTCLEVKLLPGGEYLFHNHWDLDCWNIPERKIIWTYKCCVENARVTTLAAQLTDTPDQAVVMACQRIVNDLDVNRNCVEILTLNLKTGTSQSMLVARVPRGWGTSPYEHPQICGDFAAVALTTNVVLFNWREGTYVTVDNPESSHHFRRIALAPGYAILVLSLPEHENEGGGENIDTLVLSPLTVLPWAPVDPVNPPKNVTGASDLLRVHSYALPRREEPTYDGIPQPHTNVAHIYISVHEHPLRNDLFRLWIHIAHPAILLRYDLDLRGSHPTLQLHSTTNTARDWGVHRCGASFAGHTLTVLQSGRTSISPGGHYLTVLQAETLKLMPPGAQRLEDGRGIELHGHRGFLDMSAYGGALSYLTDDSLRVRYYQ